MWEQSHRNWLSVNKCTGTRSIVSGVCLWVYTPNNRPARNSIIPNKRERRGEQPTEKEDRVSSVTHPLPNPTQPTNNPHYLYHFIIYRTMHRICNITSPSTQKNNHTYALLSLAELATKTTKPMDTPLPPSTLSHHHSTLTPKKNSKTDHCSSLSIFWPI